MGRRVMVVGFDPQLLLGGKICENGQWESNTGDRRCHQVSRQTALDSGNKRDQSKAWSKLKPCRKALGRTKSSVVQELFINLKHKFKQETLLALR